MADLFENLLVMVLSIVVLVGGFYLLLLLLDWWLKFKAGSREHEGLANLWLAAKQDTTSFAADDENAATAVVSADADRNDGGI